MERRFLKLILSILIFLSLSLSLSNSTYAETTLYKPHPSLDYIAINNIQIEIDEYGKILVDKQDTVKIAGRGNPNQNITIYIGNEYLNTKGGSTGNWSVLFSIHTLEEEFYPIYISINGGEKELLFTLGIGKELSQIENGDEEIDNKEDSNVLIIVLSIFGLITVSVIGTMLYLKKKTG